jgi:chorismate lyase / 3-hydroxybenzoate synthase
MASAPYVHVLDPPAWLDAIFDGRSIVAPSASSRSIEIRIRRAECWTLVTARCPAAHRLGSEGFEALARECYERIAVELQALKTCYPVRFWNLIPQIRTKYGGALDRYMVFNAGRYAGYTSAFGGEETFSRSVATATGVGHDGDELVVHALAARQPGTHIENPRQTSAYQYPKRYGPKPPTFARATVVTDLRGSSPTVLVGGTASVVGYESEHVGDLPGQLEETMLNMASLLRAACDRTTTHQNEEPASLSWLERMEDIRVYYLHSVDGDTIRNGIRRFFTSTAKVEFYRADLCRADLLVEIEGTARGLA